MMRTLSLLCAFGLAAFTALPVSAQETPELPPAPQDEMMEADSTMQQEMQDDAMQDETMDDRVEETVEESVDETIDTMADQMAPEEAGDFSEWDEDGDGVLERQEFARTGYYERWNTDDFQGLTRSEFGKGYRELGFFDKWSGDERRVARDRFGFTDEEWFGNWDRDHSDDLSRLEFAQGAFDTWDVNDDGLLDSNELNRGVLSAWDRDQSGNWNTDEWADASPWLDGTGTNDPMIRP